MHPRRSWIALCVLAAFAAQAAVIYKWTDPQGVVHYSDQPVPGAQRIVTAAPNTATNRFPNPGGGNSPSNNQPNTPAPRIAIVSPVPEQTYFNNEIVTVSLDIQPPLKGTQSIVWHLNGKALTDQPPSATSFTLQGLDRGTYAIAATVTDQSTGETQSSGSVTFFVHQPSELSPQHRR